MSLSLQSLFDERYYLATNPDVATAVRNGVFTSGFAHFQALGKLEGRNPSAYFNTSYYLSSNPDVAAAIRNKLVSSAYDHYIAAGQFEGRSPIAQFSESYYLTNNRDIAAAVRAGTFSSGFEHFFLAGQFERRMPSAIFNEGFYLVHNPDVLQAVNAGAFRTGFEHFVIQGQAEGRSGINRAPVLANDAIATNEDVAVALANVLANDRDPDRDTLSVIRFTSGRFGSVTSSTNGQFIYRPSANRNGVDSFTYTVRDGFGGTSAANVFVTVRAVNDVPIARNDAASTLEDRAVTLSNVLANDTDADGDRLTILRFGQGSRGTVTQVGNGFVYTPASDFFGTDRFTYTVVDGRGGTSTATVNVTVTAVNDAPPLARPDSATTLEDRAVTLGNVLANDTDIDGEPITLLENSTPRNGTLTALSGNRFVYTPNSNFNGVDSFTYTVSDGNGGTSAGTVLITVQSVNDVPVAVSDRFSISEDGLLNFTADDLLGNDTDIDGGTLSLLNSNFGQPANGDLQGNGDGSYTYTPDSNFAGVDSFTYTVRDGQGGTTVGRVFVTVTGVNDVPIAGSDGLSTREDTGLTINLASGLFANDSDGDGDVLNLNGFTQPARGTLRNNLNGTLTYQPSRNFNGVDSFTYTVSDGRGGSDTATVFITVSSVEDLPVAGNDRVSTNEDTALSIAVSSLLSNDSDEDGNVFLDSFTQPGRGSLEGLGDFLQYTPAEDFNGIDSFTYTISDQQGNLTTATVFVTVNAVEDPAIANDDAFSTVEDTALTIVGSELFSNDDAGDGSSLSISTFSQGGRGSVRSINNGQTLVYRPNSNFAGVDSFTYTINNGRGGTDVATVLVTVGNINDAPVVINDGITTQEEAAVTVNVLANDTDIDGQIDPATLTVVTGPSNGSVLTSPITGQVVYTPNSNFFGVDSFTYTVEDDAGATSTPATVFVTVAPVNDAPVAGADSVSTNEDAAVSLNVLANDSDVDGTVNRTSITIASQPGNGTAFYDPFSGQVVYRPASNFNGVDSFTYTITDNLGVTSAPAVVTVTVNDVNDVPTGVADTGSTSEDTAVTLNVLVNDTDIDGNLVPGSVAVEQSTNGSVSVNPDGTLVYTPNSDFNGVDSFAYTVEDNDGGVSAPTTVTVTVSPVNDAPRAIADSVSTNEDTALTFNVVANDTDVDGSLNPGSVVVTAPTNGSATVDANGVVTYTPNSDFNGVDSFTYTLVDGEGATSTPAVVTVTVNAVNDAPLGVADSASVDEDGILTLDVIANDTDIDGSLDASTVAVVTGPTSGSVSIDESGAVIYTPDSDFFGVDSFTYTVADDSGATTAPTTVTVTVNPVNDAPVATDDTATVNEDGQIAINVLANDSDVDNAIGDLTVELVADPTQGSVEIDATDPNRVVYTPDADFNGIDSFTYVVVDADGASSSVATVFVTVNGVNDAPVATNDAISTDEDTAIAINVLANDTDIDAGDAILPSSVAIASQGSSGSATVNAETGEITYTPDDDFFGVDSFTYTVADGNGATSTPATVFVTVNPVSDPPTAVNDAISTDEETAVSLNVLANDTDVDGDLILQETLSVVSAPSNGSVTVDLETGVVTYNPNSDFFGVDSFTYTVFDETGSEAQPATVFVTVNNVNDAPFAVNDSLVIDEDTVGSVNIITNDTDVDGSLVRSSLTLVSRPSNGSVLINRLTGVATYRPNSDFFGVDSFTYTVRDNSGATSAPATVLITVNGVNDAPRILGDSATTNEDTLVSINVLANDTDVDGSLVRSSVSVISGPSSGSATVGPNGVVSYTPGTDFFGVDSFTYTVTDNSGATATPATVFVTVAPVNDAPRPVADTASTEEDSAIAINVLANDTDVDDSLVPSSVSIASDPGNGSVSVNPETGVVTYTPDTDFFGVDSFTYTVTDDGGATSAPTTVTVTVSPVNDAPRLVGDAISTDEDTAITFSAIANDTDVDGTLDATTVAIVSEAGNGSVTIDDTTGDITYTPDANFFGVDSFTYTVADNDGVTGAPATVFVTVNDINDAPVSTDDFGTTDEDTVVKIDLLANDSDLDGTLNPASISILSGPSSGSFSLDPSSGVVTYTPDTNFFGVDSFTYTVADDDGDTSAPATVLVTVLSVNDPAFAVNDSATTNEDTAVSIDLLANDFDDDGNLLPASVVVVSEAANGSVSIDAATGAATYTPDSDFFGVDSFTYQVSSDDGSTSNLATVTITVLSVNDAPIAANDTASTLEDSAVTINVAANDTDVDGRVLPTTVAIVSNGTSGTATVNPNTGEVTYTPGSNFFGVDSFTYTVGDTDGATAAPATVFVTVAPVNDAPVGVADTTSTDEDTAVTIDILGNDTDIDSAIAPDSVVITTSPTNGSVTLDASGAAVYTPNSNFNGVDSFVYTVADEEGAVSGPIKVTVTVRDVNDPPIAGNDRATVAEDSFVQINVLANDTDVDGDLRNPSVVTGPSNGAVNLTGTGTFIYTPSANFNGVDSFTYTVSDNDGGTAVATVTVTVTPVNDAPTAVGDRFTVAQGTPLTISSAQLLSNDTDIDGDTTLNVVNVSTPSRGTLTQQGGSYVYTPGANFSGNDSFTYTVADGNGGSATATVNLVVAQSVPEAQFTSTANANIFRSTEIPHATVQATGDGSFDYYVFEVTSPGVAYFDIDFGVTSGGVGDVDTELFLFNSAGALLAENDDSLTSNGAGGSTKSDDAFIEYTFTEAGTYVIGVGAFDSSVQPGSGIITGSAPAPGSTYTLHISLENGVVPPLP